MIKLPGILALDPGGTTGWCHFDPAGTSVFDSIRKPFDYGQIAGPGHHKVLFDFLIDRAEHRVTPELHIVCERFEFRKDKERDKIEYISGQYEGVVELFCKIYKHANVTLAKQSASLIQGKDRESREAVFWTDDKLKQLGLYRPNCEHAMDAIKHYLYYRAFTLNDISLFEKLR